MKLFATLFLTIFCYSASFGQEKEENFKPQINLMCDESVDKMALYIIDDKYYITKDQELVLPKIDNYNIIYIGLIEPGDKRFNEEVNKTPYADKIQKVIILVLREGTPLPFETKEAV